MIKKLVGDKPKIEREDIRKGDFILSWDTQTGGLHRLGEAFRVDEEGDWWTNEGVTLTNRWVPGLEHYLIDRPKSELSVPMGSVIRVKEIIFKDSGHDFFQEVDFVGFVCEGFGGPVVRSAVRTADRSNLRMFMYHPSEITKWDVLWMPPSP